jgi:hypothetical protein
MSFTEVFKKIFLKICMYLIIGGMGFKLRASHLLGRHSTT